ncbi:unnamed protein product [Meloidogyne enterolobii]|uniref:Uncharacterized protein n=2 Tax=Meloidogyne enterolobii TaxID=390850 RepID=A0ACB1AH99_MELEN
MSETALIDEALNEVFVETDLIGFQSLFVFDKQLTRLEHFYDVTDEELKSYGLSEPAIRRLRQAIVKKSKKQSKTLFGGGGKKNVKLIQVKREKTVNSCNKSLNEGGFEFNNTQPFLISENEISLYETLGEGNFSIVKRAIWNRSDNNSSKIECAVKILHNNMTEIFRKDLLAEITNMQKLRHQNLVQLFGVVFGENTLMVLEYCQGGSLLDRLKNCGNGKFADKIRPLITTLHNYTQQIVNGMAYLESRRCVHRDLAARNVLLAHDEQIVKICDFGLARALSENERLYVMNELKKVPFSWCPPESLRYRQFSHKSDVWAFGVTMWELYTFCEEPWAGCRAAEVLQLIESGQRLKQPEYCPPQIYEIMKMCWYNEPEQRPKFVHLRKMLLDIKFTHVVCRQSYTNNNINNSLSTSTPQLNNDEINFAKKATFLNISQGDQFCLICEKNLNFYFGQNLKTRQFGQFPKLICCVVNNEGGNEENTKINNSSNKTTITNNINNTTTIKLKEAKRGEISFPVVGSFIHTGHGDLDERQCWGHVDHIDQIYLQNPIIGASTTNINANQQPPIIVPSLLNLQNCVKNNSKSFTNLNEAKSQQENENNKIYHRTITTTKINEKPTSIFDVDLFDPFTTKNNKNEENGNGILRKNSLPTIGAIKQEQQKPSLNSIFLRPPPTSKNNGLSNGANTSTTSSTKYDYSMSIPRPNRISPTNSLTPPDLSKENLTKNVDQQKISKIEDIPLKPTNTNLLLDLSKEQFVNLNLNNFLPQQQQASTQRPKSAHFLFDELKQGLQQQQQHLNASIKQPYSLIDDPFTVKDDIKTLLNTKLPYREIHKSCNGGFSSNTSNVAIVHPIQQQQPILVNNALIFDINNSAKLQQGEQLISKNDGGGSYFDENFEKNFCPQNLSANNFCPQNLSANSFILPTQQNEQQKSSSSLSFINSNTYGHPNDIPKLLNPIKIPHQLQQHQEPTSTTRNIQQKIPHHQIVDLSELDTDALLKQVKDAVDFASLEQCRQQLWRNQFDAERAIQQLKIDKLLEMGLATDRELAASALDCEQWNVNAAANRLCSS